MTISLLCTLNNTERICSEKHTLHSPHLNMLLGSICSQKLDLDHKCLFMWLLEKKLVSLRQTGTKFPESLYFTRWGVVEGVAGSAH